MAKRPGHVRITDVSCYPNLEPALGCIVGCQIEELVKGCELYHVSASSLANLGCEVGDDVMPFPFYPSEAEVVNEG